MYCFNTSADSVTTCGNGTMELKGDNPYVFSPFFHDKVSRIVILVTEVIFVLLATSFGIVTNLINLVVFKRLGLNDSVNISFFGMAVSDLIMQVNYVLIAIYKIPLAFTAKPLARESDVIMIVLAWVHLTMVRTTGWITALVSTERCLCIVLPLKVHQILSPKRIKILVCLIFIVSNLFMLPVYTDMGIRSVFVPRYNMSVLHVHFYKRNLALNRAMGLLNGAIFTMTTFVIVTVTTIFQVVHLRRMTRQRQKMTVMKEDDVRQRKLLKLIKMVTVVTSVFIASYTPTCLLIIATMLFNFVGIPWTPATLQLVDYLAPATILLELLNSSVNIFIYYNMSTKYKEKFRHLFCKDELESKEKM